MANRLTSLLGLAAVLLAIGAGLLAGAASAAAETGSGSDGDGTSTSGSTQHETSKSDPATNGTKSPSPAGQQNSTGTEATDVGKPATETSETDPETSPPTGQAETRKTTRHTSRGNKSGTSETTSGTQIRTATPKTEDDTSAVKTETSPSSHEISAAAGESTTTPGLDTSVGDHAPQSQTEGASPVDLHVAETSTRSIAVSDQAPASPRKPTLIDFVGSIALNVVMGLMHAFDGAPVLPAGSTVTVRTSTLTIPVAGGRTVQADWYFPDDDGETPTRLIYLQHGFGASGPMYSYTAAGLAEQTNSIVVAPSLSSNFFDADAAWLGGTPMQQGVADLFVGDREALTESASAAAGHEVTLPARFVLAGHSLGGSLVMGAAGDLVGTSAFDDLAGVLLLDGVDVNNSVPTALQKLTGANYRPVYDISSERYVWNMYGKVGDELEAARPGQFNGVMLVGGRHIDALQGGNPLLQFAEYLFAGFSQQQNVEAVKTLAAGWVNDMFAGTHDGIYGAPQQNIPISTAAGTATAVVFPFTSTQRVQATPYDGISALILNVLQSFFVYEPLAGAAAARTV